MRLKQAFILGLLCMLAIVQCNENEASSETETETKLPQGLVRGDWTNKDSPYLRLDVDLAETKAVTDVSIGFWVRFSTKDPKTVLVKDVRANRWYAAGVTEGKDWGGLSEKKNSLLHLSWWMDYVQNQVLENAGTYTTTSATPYMQNYLITENVDSCWQYEYIGASHTTQKLVYFNYGTRSNFLTYKEISGIQHYQGNDRGPFTFTVGSTLFGNYGFPGYFFDVRFDFKNAIIGTRLAAFDFLKKQAKLPPQMNPDSNFVQIVGDTELASKEGDQFTESSQYFKKFFKFYGAEEYSIQGWFKFDGNFRANERYCLFRLVGNEPGELSESTNEGDQLLYVFLINGNIYIQWFKTYLGQPITGVLNTYVSISQAAANQYFWVYAGYSSLSKKIFFYVRTFDNEYKTYFNDAYMNIPRYFGLYITRDPFFSKYAWNGVVRNLYFRVGRGSLKVDQYTDNYINMKDMNCATLYSECQYTGNSHQICSSQNTFDPNFSVQSIYVPSGKKIKLFKQASLQGASVEFLSSQECLQSIDFAGSSPAMLQQMGVRLLEEHETAHMRDNNLQVHMQNSQSNTLSSPPEDEEMIEETKQPNQRKLKNQAAL